MEDIDLYSEVMKMPDSRGGVLLLGQNDSRRVNTLDAYVWNFKRQNFQKVQQNLQTNKPLFISPMSQYLPKVVGVLKLPSNLLKSVPLWCSQAF